MNPTVISIPDNFNRTYELKFPVSTERKAILPIGQQWLTYTDPSNAVVNKLYRSYISGNPAADRFERCTDEYKLNVKSEGLSFVSERRWVEPLSNGNMIEGGISIEDGRLTLPNGTSISPQGNYD